MTSHLGRDRLAVAFWGLLTLYVCVLSVGSMIALRNVSLIALLGLTLWQVWRGGLSLVFPLRGAWGLYAAVACASLAYASDFRYSLHEVENEILPCLMVLLIAASWVRNAPHFERLAWLLALGNLFFVAGSAWTLAHTGLADEGIGSWKRGVGDTASTITAVFPWLVVLAQRNFARGRYPAAWGLVLLAGANLGALYLSMNRQGWLALAVSLGLMGFLAGRSYWTRGRVLLAVLCAAGLLGVLAVQLQSRPPADGGPPAAGGVDRLSQAVGRDVRWSLWQYSLERIAERPWSGGGFGREAFKREYPDYYRTHNFLWHAHNMVINKGIQMGVPGMLAFLLLWLALARAGAPGLADPTSRPWAIALLAMMGGVFVRNMTDDFFYRDHALLFWLIGGAFIGSLRGARQ